MRKKIIKIFGDHAACREAHAVKQLSLAWVKIWY